MPTIVKHVDKKTGKTRVFESTPHYDPVSKQSRPIRRYLGTLYPETGELIPSCGRKGRTKLNFPPIFYKHGRIDKNYL